MINNTPFDLKKKKCSLKRSAHIGALDYGNVRALLYAHTYLYPPRTPRSRAKRILRTEYVGVFFYFFQNRVLINHARRTIDRKRVRATYRQNRVGGVIYSPSMSDARPRRPHTAHRRF